LYSILGNPNTYKTAQTPKNNYFAPLVVVDCEELKVHKFKQSDLFRVEKLSIGEKQKE
jgi:hypothetical protein